MHAHSIITLTLTLCREISDNYGIAALIGDYRTRCLFSKVWGLREAVINKVRLLNEEEYSSTVGLAQSINALCAIVRVGIDDKLSQLMFSAIPLLDDVLVGIKREKLNRNIIGPPLEPVVLSLIEKLNDGAARVRETSLKSLMAIAACSSIGPALVGSRSLIPIQGKQKSLARPLVGRLQVLTGLVAAYGIGGNTSLSCENLMGYCKQAGAFAHSNGEVRDACKDLAVALQKIVGTDPIEPYLQVLRPKQIEEYMTAFGEVKKPVARAEEKTFKSESKQNTNKERMSSPRVPVTHLEVKESNAKRRDEAPAEEAPDFTTCMFCGKSDRKWNEDALDLHYWKDCPLLIPCQACAQVVEIAGLPEHLVEECDAKNEYLICDVTGLAIKKSEYLEWKDSPECQPAPADHMYCPLCQEPVADSDEDWKAHLVSTCTKNKRST